MTIKQNGINAPNKSDPGNNVKNTLSLRSTEGEKMKEIKITTEDGKAITAGYKDANHISIAYRYFPKHNVTQYHVSALVFGTDGGEFYHEWTPLKQSSL